VTQIPTTLCRIRLAGIVLLLGAGAPAAIAAGIATTGAAVQGSVGAVAGVAIGHGRGFLLNPPLQGTE